MEFTIKTINESDFKNVLKEITDENNIDYPNAITINKNHDTDYSTIILTELFIDRLDNISPDLVKKLQAVK